MFGKKSGVPALSVALSLIAMSSIITTTICATPTFAVSTDVAEADKVIPEDLQQAAIDLPGHAAFTGWRDSKKNPWAAVLCLHGLSMHKETYEPLGKRLSKLGIATYAMDVRGFGVWKESDPKKKVDYEQTFADVREGLEYLRRMHPTVPVFILGESMGGALALQSAARYPELVDGCITSVPQGTGKYVISTALRVLLTGILRGPNAEVNMNRVMSDRVSKKPEVVKTLITDPKVRRTVKVKDLFAMKVLLSANHRVARQVTTTPVLIFQGYRDRLIPAASAIKLFNDVGTPDKDLVLAGQSEHLIFEEGQFTDYMFDSLVSWIDKNANASPIVTPSEMDAKFVVRKRSRDAEFLRELRTVQNYYRLKQWDKATATLNHALEVGNRDRTPTELRDYLSQLSQPLIAPPTKEGTEGLFEQSGLANLGELGNGGTRGVMVALFTDKSLAPVKQGAEEAKYFEDKSAQRANVEMVTVQPVKGAHKSRAKAQEKSFQLADFAETHKDVKLITVDINSPEGKKAARQLGVINAPTVLVFSCDRQISYYQIGKINKEELDAKLQSLTTLSASR